MRLRPWALSLLILFQGLSSAIAHAETQAQPREARPASDWIQYLFALDLGYGGLSGGGLGLTSGANTLQYSAYGMLAFRVSIAGASLALGPYIETGYGRETGVLSILGGRSAMMSGNRYGVGTLARYDNYYLMGSLVFLGNLDLNASSAQVKSGTGPDSLSFGSPLGIRLSAGMELKYGISLHASYTRKALNTYSYTTVIASATTQTTQVDTSSDPLIDSNFAIGLSASY